MQQDRPDLAAKQILKAAVQAGEDQVQRPEQLIGQRGTGQDPTTTHPAQTSCSTRASLRC